MAKLEGFLFHLILALFRPSQGFNQYQVPLILLDQGLLLEYLKVFQLLL